MRTFRVAYTGDFLNEDGDSAYGDIRLDLLQSCGFLQFRFLADQAPRRGDADYWQRFYKLQITADQIAGLDGLVVLRPFVTRAIFERGAGDLAVIGRSGAGYDKIDVAACTDNDVALFNAPLALNHATASAALLFMLALAKNLHAQQRIARLGRWDLQAQTMAGEIEGRTLGIIGLGHSGRELARLVAPFHMNIVAYSPHAVPAQAASLGVHLTDLNQVLREADFVSLHCRLTDETRDILKGPELALMKPTAFLINVARGELVDQPALVECLQKRRIAGAALDVFAVEPLPVNDPLLGLDNVLITPHWLASSKDVWRATGQTMAVGMIRAATGHVPENVVNREVLNRTGFRQKLQRFEQNQSGKWPVTTC